MSIRSTDIHTGIPTVDRAIRRIVDVLNSLESRQRQFHVVHGQPAEGMGQDGDEAFDRETQTFYKKADNTWHSL